MWGDSGNAGGDPEANVLEAAQFLHQRVYFPRICPLRIKNGFGIIEKQYHLPRGQEWSQRSQILGVFDPCTNGLGESGEEVGARSRELIATDESPVIAKFVLDAIMVENSERDGCFPNPPRTDESNGFQVFSKSDNLLD